MLTLSTRLGLFFMKMLFALTISLPVLRIPPIVSFRFLSDSSFSRADFSDVFPCATSGSTSSSSKLESTLSDASAVWFATLLFIDVVGLMWVENRRLLAPSTAIRSFSEKRYCKGNHFQQQKAPVCTSFNPQDKSVIKQRFDF